MTTPDLRLPPSGAAVATDFRQPIDARQLMHTANGIAFVKGHGTENDFILIPDPDGTLDISPGQVRALCDRHAGIGADGIIRIAPAAGGAAGFVMDYRNADGSLAEMCGNGARVFARFLVDAGWSAAGRIAFETRGGVRVAQVPVGGDVTIGMGPVRVGDVSTARLDGVDFPGVAVDVGNPHLVCLTRVPLESLDLSRPPLFDHTAFPEGVNIEFAVPGSADAQGIDRVAMRVYERGVGETRSCGTGTVAVAAAHLAATGRAMGTVRVSVPGGDVTVTVTTDDATLTGPAVLLAAGTVDRTFWESQR